MPVCQLHADLTNWHQLQAFKMYNNFSIVQAQSIVKIQNLSKCVYMDIILRAGINALIRNFKMQLQALGASNMGSLILGTLRHGLLEL